MSNNKIIEEESDVGDGGDVNFQIGDSVVAFTYPSTEGLIISQAISEEGRLELTLIVAPYKKRGQAWSRATVITRDAARLSKKTMLNFNFPIKNIEVLRTEAKKARGDPAWAFATCVTLDREFSGDTSVSGASDSEGKEDGRRLQTAKISSSSSKVNGEMSSTEKKYESLESRMGEVEQLGEVLQRKEVKRSTESSDSDYEAWKRFRRHNKKKQKKKVLKKKKKSATSDSSSSSSSSDSDSSREGEVGEKGKSGMFTCPFHESDARGYKDVKCQIKGQTVTRKNIRVALHNLYGAHHTLSSFADALVAKANSSVFKPFSTDTAWLQAYATNIDGILLGNLTGPWTLWNEPCLDDMMTGFLELVVRVAPNKEYPACLDDAVRKWMKKKRIGTNTKYGPISFAMQHAKCTDSGLLVAQSGWQKSREKPMGKPTTNSNVQKGPPVASNAADKKPPPFPNQA